MSAKSLIHSPFPLEPERRPGQSPGQRSSRLQGGGPEDRSWAGPENQLLGTSLESPAVSLAF